MITHHKTKKFVDLDNGLRFEDNKLMLRQRVRGKKAVRVERWDMGVLETIAFRCKLISSSQTQEDWDMFLLGVYEALKILGQIERVVILASQEFSISKSDIARVLNMQPSTIDGIYKMGVRKITDYMLGRNLLHKLGDDGESLCPAIRNFQGFQNYDDPARTEGDIIDHARTRQILSDGIEGSIKEGGHLPGDKRESAERRTIFLLVSRFAQQQRS